ncbi:hypothetical protein M409DRAFT_29016 [Zasmidium cellare ATCC 36951]|uniref:Major facilitator superfamily (MFS) profile domain-containing protein n=1 Tax=Zasmidium cellare ATCC 36951 TaxID=1080233 RepID=A0A6A6C2W3_ZASCE|nr:uncharacterized protein M409DRAFT_29016 [Zasmidium cellare ATCC 36951]KAF2160628.1 hypothetical protein M409DRAFT_29016 [Zasmidium cellare ATCC 36951]
MHGKKDQALTVLNKLRPAEDVENGTTVLEVEAIEQAVVLCEEQDMGRWIDIFRGTYLRRTVIGGFLGAFCQITGGQFINTYGPTFYKDFGLGDKAFTYALITTVLILVTQSIALYGYDRLGRRPIMILGSIIQVPLMIVVAACGSAKHPSGAKINAVVDSCIMFASFQRMATESPTYIIGSEIGGVKLRRKIMTWCIVWNVLGAFATTFSVPYLLNAPYANLHAKVGWIFAGISLASFVFVVFFVPEFKGRSLEEIDELFEKKLKAWQFAKAETSGIGAQIAMLEGATKHHAAKLDEEAMEVTGPKAEPSHVENIADKIERL